MHSVWKSRSSPYSSTCNLSSHLSQYFPTLRTYHTKGNAKRSSKNSSSSSHSNHQSSDSYPNGYAVNGISYQDHVISNGEHVPNGYAVNGLSYQDHVINGDAINGHITHEHHVNGHAVNGLAYQDHVINGDTINEYTTNGYTHQLPTDPSPIQTSINSEPSSSFSHSSSSPNILPPQYNSHYHHNYQHNATSPSAPPEPVSPTYSTTNVNSLESSYPLNYSFSIPPPITYNFPSPPSKVFPVPLKPRLSKNPIPSKPSKPPAETPYFIQQLSKPPPILSLQAFNDSILNAVRAGQVKPCMILYEMMKQSQIHPDVLTFELIISAHVGTPQSSSANRLFTELLECKLTPSPAIYEKLIVINSNDPALCDQIYNHMRVTMNMNPDPLVARVLVLSHLQKNCSQSSLQRCKEIVEDLLHYSAITSPDILNIMLEYTHEEEAIYLYEYMIGKDISPDTSTFNTLIGKAKGNKEIEDEWLIEMGERGVEHNLVTYNVRILNATRRRDAEEAKRLYEEMKERGVEPDIITYQQLTLFTARMGEHEYCWKLVQEMKEKGWS